MAVSTTPDDQTDHPAPHGVPGAVPPPPPSGGPGQTGQPGHGGPAGGAYPPPPPYGQQAQGGGQYGQAGQHGQAGQAGQHGQYGQYGQYGQGAAYPPPGAPPQGYAQGYGQGYGPTPAYGPGAPLSPSDQRLWAVLAHLGNLLVWILAPLVVWLAFRGRGAFLEDHAKESVNFQITAALAALALSVVTLVTFGIGALLYIPLGAAWLVLLIVAAVKASQGEAYRYPLTLRLVR